MSKNDKIDVVPTKEDDASPENKVPVTSAATQEDSDQEDTVEFEEGKSSILRKRTNEMREKMRYVNTPTSLLRGSLLLSSSSFIC